MGRRVAMSSLIWATLALPPAAVWAEPPEEAKTEPAAEAKSEPAAEAKSEPTPEPAAEAKTEPTAAPAPEPAGEPAPEPAAEPAPEPAAEPAPEPTAAADAPPVILDRPTFQMQVPAGYTEAKEDRRAKLLARYPREQSSLIVADNPIDAANPFFGTVVILPLKGDMRGILVEEARCQKAAEANAERARGAVAWAKRIELGFGPTCQWRVAGPEGTHHHAVFTRAIAAAGQFTITCHFDDRDSGGEARCTEMAATFQFKPGA